MARSLLIADDALIIREMIKDAATSAGWRVAGCAENGQQAIELYETLHPDAVTLDLVMPEHDGLHALAGIRAKHPNAKVLIVSALDQKEILKEAFKLGATDFIVKPFDRQNLVKTLDSLVPAPSVPA